MLAYPETRLWAISTELIDIIKNGVFFCDDFKKVQVAPKIIRLFDLSVLTYV